MTAVSGRALKIYRGTGGSRIIIAGVRTSSMTINNATVDITDKEDSGWTTLLAAAGSKNVSFEASGIFKSANLLEFALASTTQDDFEIDIVGYGTMSGKFNISTFSPSGTHDAEGAYSASFASSGAITWTAD